MMKPGRNDPCACGSGKKYKKCCLPKEQQEVVSARQAEQAQRQMLKAPPVHAERIAYKGDDAEMLFDADDAALTRYWNDFQAANPEGRIQLFLQALEQRDILDDELAFDMLAEIHTDCLKGNERGRIATLLDALEARLPEIYDASALYYSAWRIENALVLAEQDRILPLAAALGERADKNIDLFSTVREQLAYHGQLTALLAAMHTAYPKVHNNDQLLIWGQNEFVDQAMKFVIFDYLERTVTPDLSDPGFLQALRYYGSADPAKLVSVVGRLSGELQGTWTLSDFQNETIHQELDGNHPSHDPDTATLVGRLRLIALEFVAYLHRDRAMPYTKANLGACELCNYLVERYSGAVRRRKSASAPGRHRKPKTKSAKSLNALYPDPASMRRYLERATGFLMNTRYPLGAALEIIPAWMDYLLSRGLCEIAEPGAVISGIKPICQELIALFEQTIDDPVLPQNLRTAYGLPG